MNVLIIEDELLAQQKLEAMLLTLDARMSIVARLGSVKESLRWLKNNHEPDVAFVDIQLSDDHSFEIFRQHTVRFPIIFTTAYDRYILESFEFNSIDYLLKPITEEKLKHSLEKIKQLQRHFLQGNILNLVNQREQKTMSRVIARKGTEYVVVDIQNVAYFYTEHKIVFVRDFEGRQWIVDHTLSDLEQQLNREAFFRINRKFLSSLKAIKKFKPDGGKIEVFLQPEAKESVHVSKETAPLFRSWVTGKNGF